MLNFALAGGVLGLGLSSKISALWLVPISTGLIVLWALTQRELLSRDENPIQAFLKEIVLPYGVYGSTAFLELWAVHGFTVGPLLSDLPIPLPAPTFWRALLRVQAHVSTGDSTYLLGETYRGGRWYFFPVVLALKTPIPTLLLLAATTVLVWKRMFGKHRSETSSNVGEPNAGGRDVRRRSLTEAAAGRRSETSSNVRNPRLQRILTLVSFPISYFAISIASEINLGYRHLLPMWPFLYLSLG
jgi:hypothetical protein